MRTLYVGCLTLASSVAGHLATPAKACGHDTFAAERARPAWPDAVSSLPAHAVDPHSSRMPALVDVPAEVHALEGASDDPATTAGRDPHQVDLDESDDVVLDDMCVKQCGTVQNINLLPGVIFEQMAALPVLGAFVVPVTTGVTIEPGQGLPALTFAVKPTKITRGSGFVAIARF
jgi:hypothetical protein